MSSVRRLSQTPSQTSNKREAILAAAARRFSRVGFAATSMRDIAADADLLAGSIYHHFPSKEEILAAAYTEGVDQIAAAVAESAPPSLEPWQRLEEAVTAHLEAIVAETPFAALLTLDLRQLDPPLVKRLAAERDRYERQFVAVMNAVELPAGTDRRLARLMLLGALNWTPTWYRRGGASPRRIAQSFVRILQGGTAT